MPRGSPFYQRTRDWSDEVGPPYAEADVFDEYEAAHHEASTRIVGIEGELDQAVKSDDLDSMRKMTQSAYDQLGTKDPRVFYIIIG